MTRYWNLFIFCGLTLSLLSHSVLHAYDEYVVHRTINKSAAQAPNSSLEEALKRRLGFPRGLKTEFNGSNILEILRMGGMREDEDPRWIDHFHDPLKPWDEAGLSGDSRSALTWAQFPDTIGGDGPNHYSWISARNYFYQALTTSSDEHWASTFRALGQVMHVVSDMAVPAHVRDDTHPRGEPYEGWAALNRRQDSYSSVPVDLSIFRKAVADPSWPIPISALWDQNAYDGSVPQLGQVGLAEFTNAYFLSADASLQTCSGCKPKKYLHPAPEDTDFATIDWKHPETVLVTGDLGPPIPNRRLYVHSLDLPQIGDRNPRLAAVGYLCLDGKNKGKVLGLHKSPYFVLDDMVYGDYASLLIPRAVGYSAALLDYFFRGTMDVERLQGYRDASGSLIGVDLRIRNDSKLGVDPEPMAAGSIALVSNYRLVGADQKTHVLKENIYTIADADDAINTDFVSTGYIALSQPIPTTATEVSFTLVYRGKLGNELDAIAAKVFDPPSKIAYSFQPGGPPQPSEIHTIYSDGTGETPLTDSVDGYPWHWMPSWSADGTRLAVTAATPENHYDLLVIDVSSQQPYPNNLIVKRHSFAPYMWSSFSPDGRQLVTYWDYGRVLIILDVASGEWRYINDEKFWENQRYPEDPQWSPRGDQIVYVWRGYRGEVTFHGVIMSIHPDGTANVALTDDAHDSLQPAWSRDGEQITYTSKENGAAAMDLWIMRRDGSNKRRVLECPIDCAEPSFSPDGQQIVFTYGYYGDELYAINVDDSGHAQLTSSGYSKASPSWSPLLFDGSCPPQ